MSADHEVTFVYLRSESRAAKHFKPGGMVKCHEDVTDVVAELRAEVARMRPVVERCRVAIRAAIDAPLAPDTLMILETARHEIKECGDV